MSMNSSSMGCFPLTGSTSCPELSGYSVISTAQIANLAAFDSYVMKSMDSSPDFMSGFQSTYGCPGYMGHSLRFHQSLMCNYFVSFSMNQCTPPATPYKPLCQSSCFAHINSVNAVFMDPMICTPTPTSQQQMARAIFMTASPSGQQVANTNVYYDSCYTMFKSNDTNMCSAGLVSDVNNAGFFISSDATPFCASTGITAIDQMLCQNLGKLPATGMTPVNVAGCGSGTACQMPQMPGLNIPINRAQKLALVLPARDVPWIASGATWAAMTFATLTWIVFLKTKNFGNETTLAVQPEGMSQSNNYVKHREGEEPYRVGTIARGRATLRRQAGGGEQKQRKSIFESMFGGRSRSGDSAYAPPSNEELRDRRGTFADSEIQSRYDDQSRYDEQSRYAESQYDDGQTDGGSYVPGDEGLFVKMQVVEAYEAQQSDELSLSYGEILIIQETYDDGWASAQKESTGAIGAVPLSCLADLGERRPSSYRRSGVSQRASSYGGRR